MEALATKTAETNESTALNRGVDALLEMQRPDGSWEGECVWNPMLAAQYVITAEIVGIDIPANRREGLLDHFRVTRNGRGIWGLHPYEDGSLFVTTLVYVAARLLGASPDSAWLADARGMFASEGVERIPTWGKVWLAILGLYDWEGVNPIIPEVWALPSFVPIHPANYYCHTRSIYLGLAVLYGERFAATGGGEIDAIRGELYGGRYSEIDFSKHTSDVREADAPFRPGVALRAVFAVCKVFDRHHSEQARRALLSQLRERMRRDLRASDHLALSPVNGLLSILGLWGANPHDHDLRLAIERLDAWFWEDHREGARVAGAGSVCWDTSFALQALSLVPQVDRSLERGSDFLASQQIEHLDLDFRRAHRIDPKGGWCFSEVGHGWPVSDCTAEALLALLHTRPEALGREGAARAVRFILRCQNSDGGFGSYEPRKTTFPLEWMNPAEMFGRCMSERSYVECTASCAMAMAAVRKRYPDLMRVEIARALDAANKLLVESQRSDGSWEGAWGVHYIYGTMFGVRGLLATGVPAGDPKIRKACRWLLERQRPDGGWGEDHLSIRAGRYVEARASLSVQTAWALITLFEANEPNVAATARGARFLETVQDEDGHWPDDQYVGVFFETALLNYRLYRQYFPVMALALHRRSQDDAAKPWRPDASDSTHP